MEAPLRNPHRNLAVDNKVLDRLPYFRVLWLRHPNACGDYDFNDDLAGEYDANPEDPAVRNLNQLDCLTQSLVRKCDQKGKDFRNHHIE